MGKQVLRERIWDELEESGEARFPFPPHGRIPNFAGAETAAERLARTDGWANADVIKSNPDAPQRPVRRRALTADKMVYMAVPRLREEECFLRLDPAVIEDVEHATTISGSSEVGEPVRPGEMTPIDLIVSGSVAVTDEGARVGKGEGYSDLEFAVLREFSLVGDDTPTVTTVHEIQIVDEDVPVETHDVPIDSVVTPERVLETDAGEKPVGVDWDALPAEKRKAVPVLDRLAPDNV